MGEENLRAKLWETWSSRFCQRKDMKPGRLYQSGHARNPVNVAIEAEDLFDSVLPHDSKVDGVS